MKKRTNRHNAVGVTPTKKDKRWRGQFRFWLDANKPDELAIGQGLMDLKARRQFAPAIRNALRLWLDLRAGKVDVLLALFPWVADAFNQATQPAPMTNIEQQLERLEQLMLRQGAIPIPIPTPQEPSASAGPKALNVPTFDAPPLEDDDTIELDIKRDTSTASAANFINSMLALQG